MSFFLTWKSAKKLIVWQGIHSKQCSIPNKTMSKRVSNFKCRRRGPSVARLFTHRFERVSMVTGQAGARVVAGDVGAQGVQSAGLGMLALVDVCGHTHTQSASGTAFSRVQFKCHDAFQFGARRHTPLQRACLIAGPCTGRSATSAHGFIYFIKKGV